MRVFNNIKDFLYDQSYSITYYNNILYVYNYLKIVDFNAISIRLEMNGFILNISGKNLKITKMENNELNITGYIESMVFNYD